MQAHQENIKTQACVYMEYGEHVKWKGTTNCIYDMSSTKALLCMDQCHYFYKDRKMIMHFILRRYTQWRNTLSP